VCLVDYAPGDELSTLPCLHRFHPNCIGQWLLRGQSACPLCRTSVRRGRAPREGET
jgi:E3 ubiquitin-protein ligase BIG BROTHER-like protein